MKIEDQVNTVEQGRKLDSLNFSKYGFDLPYFLWVQLESGDGEFELMNKWAFQANEAHFIEMRPAYSVSELIEALPGEIHTNVYDVPLIISKEEGAYEVWYWNASYDYILCDFEDIRLPVALADCLIWAIENGFMNEEK